MKHLIDKPKEELIPALLAEIKDKLNDTVDYLPSATPSQTTELAVALINALAHAGHRKKSESSGEAVRGAVRHLIRQVQSDIEETDPGDCASILRACSTIEFQHVVVQAAK